MPESWAEGAPLHCSATAEAEARVRTSSKASTSAVVSTWHVGGTQVLMALMNTAPNASAVACTHHLSRSAWKGHTAHRLSIVSTSLSSQTSGFTHVLRHRNGEDLAQYLGTTHTHQKAESVFVDARVYVCAQARGVRGVARCSSCHCCVRANVNINLNVRRSQSQPDEKQTSGHSPQHSVRLYAQECASSR